MYRILPHSDRVVIDRESKCHARGRRPEVRVTPSYIYATQTYRQMEYYIASSSLLFYIECFYSWLRALELFCFGCFASRYFNLLRHCSSDATVHHYLNQPLLYDKKYAQDWGGWQTINWVFEDSGYKPSSGWYRAEMIDW